jgi:flagella basal body P-ring formation protein FlgA
MRGFVGIVVLAAAPALAEPPAAGGADTLEAVRTIRPGEVITLADVRLMASDAAGALTSPEEAVGMMARRLLVAGRPVLASDIGPPVLVRRNSLVRLVYERGGLTIKAEGRALSDGAEGDLVRVMNMASRQTVAGTVTADGSVAAGGSE